VTECGLVDVVTNMQEEHITLHFMVTTNKASWLYNPDDNNRRSQRTDVYKHRFSKYKMGHWAEFVNEEYTNRLLP
jgi:hypothetical protein